MIVTRVEFGLAVFLFIAASLLNWGSSFAESAVADQLEAQQIVMPKSTDNPDEDQKVTKFFEDNAGAMMSTAVQAEMYANHFIGFHLSKLPTYSQATTASRSADAALAKFPTIQKYIDDAKKSSDLVDTVFRGTILKGALLTAYAFGTLGNIAGIAALVALVAGAFMLLLSIFGLNHARHVPEDATI